MVSTQFEQVMPTTFQFTFSIVLERCSGEVSAICKFTTITVALISHAYVSDALFTIFD